jgi:hypothetical protein
LLLTVETLLETIRQSSKFTLAKRTAEIKIKQKQDIMVKGQEVHLQSEGEQQCC